MNASENKKKILFVCLGNICRSPTAEGVFRHYVEQAGYGERFEIDSAGTSGHHEGEHADSRMRAHAIRRGYDLTSLSRPISYEDFFKFDYIICMDASNRENLLRLAPTEETASKIRMMTEWLPKPYIDHVPDPYYGGAEGFERVLDIIEDTCPALLQELLEAK